MARCEWGATERRWRLKRLFPRSLSFSPRGSGGLSLAQVRRGGDAGGDERRRGGPHVTPHMRRHRARNVLSCLARGYCFLWSSVSLGSSKDRRTAVRRRKISARKPAFQNRRANTDECLEIRATPRGPATTRPRTGRASGLGSIATRSRGCYGPDGRLSSCGGGDAVRVFFTDRR